MKPRKPADPELSSRIILGFRTLRKNLRPRIETEHGASHGRGSTRKNRKRDKMTRYQSEYASRPLLLLAYADAAYASECGRYFRRLGWEVLMVAGGAEARLLAAEYHPDVVVLDTELLDESGWLTSAKISTDNPDMRIILVTNDAAQS